MLRKLLTLKTSRPVHLGLVPWPLHYGLIAVGLVIVALCAIASAQPQAREVQADDTQRPAFGPMSGSTSDRAPASSLSSIHAQAVPSDTYHLFGWNDVGVRFIGKDYSNLSLIPPGNTMWAQIIKVGTYPQLMTTTVQVNFNFPDNTDSASKTNFWQYTTQLFGKVITPNLGLSGTPLSGTMAFTTAASTSAFRAGGIPLMPFADSAPTTDQLLQLSQMTARDKASGAIIATGQVVAPVSTEILCGTCHADHRAGDNIATGNVELNILTLHDRDEGTHLVASKPVLCASCHASVPLGAFGTGKPDIPPLSIAMHNRHAESEVQQLFQQYGTTPPTTNLCYACHPGPNAQMFRGVMSVQPGFTCTTCHGTMQNLASQTRKPWVDLPRCGNCHAPQYAEKAGVLYRNDVGHGGLFCEACHNSPHAEWPSTRAQDNIMPIALQGHAGPIKDCTVCHGQNVPAGPGPHGLLAPGVTPTPTLPPPTATPAPGATVTPQPSATPTAGPTSTPSPNMVHVAVNFEPRTAPTVTGYLVDSGQSFGARGNAQSYGWDSDNTGNVRVRNSSRSPDVRFDTLAYMQRGAVHTWEIAVPNGTYAVKVVAGDPSNLNSIYRINVENTLVLSDTPSSATRWFTGTATVTVADGRLTVSNASGAVNNKICFIEINQMAANSAAQSVQPLDASVANVPFQIDDIGAAMRLIWTIDPSTVSSVKLLRSADLLRADADEIFSSSSLPLQAQAATGGTTFAYKDTAASSIDFYYYWLSITDKQGNVSETLSVMQTRADAGPNHIYIPLLRRQ